MRFRWAGLLLTAAGLALLPDLAGRAALVAAGPTVTQVMSGLDNPRGLTFGPEGALYVAEAGRGPSDQSCFANPSQSQCACGGFGAVLCSGPTGAVSRLWRGRQERVVEGLPSWSNASGRAEGPNGVAMLGLGEAYVTIGLEAAPRNVDDMRQALGEGFGRLVRFEPNGRWRFVADFVEYEKLFNPEPRVVDSNPFGVHRSRFPAMGSRVPSTVPVLMDASRVTTWTYGDGSSGTGMAVSHTYAAPGGYVVTLAVFDEQGSTATASQNVRLNSLPTASFTSTCNALTCTFNASGSSDTDGMIVSYVWNLGDGTTGSGATITHTYAAAGSFTVTLLVTDDSGGAGTRTTSVTVVLPTIHIGDLDGVSTTQANMWTASVTITVHDMSHGPVTNAAVSGSWNDGSVALCTTNALGRCVVVKSGISRKISTVRLTVANVALSMFAYKPANNHDPDGESDGTTITVSR